MLRNLWQWRGRLLLAYLLAGLLLPIVAGCGYRLVGASSEAPHLLTVAVPVFRNLTYRPAGEGVFTEELVQALNRHGATVRDTAGADYVIVAEIVSLATKGNAFSAKDLAVLYQLAVDLDVTILKRSENRILHKERVSRRVAYPAQAERAMLASVEDAALADLARQVAEVVSLRFLALSGGEARQ